MASTMFETFQDFPVSCFTVLKLRVRLSKVMRPEPQLPITKRFGSPATACMRPSSGLGAGAGCTST